MHPATTPPAVASTARDHRTPSPTGAALLAAAARRCRCSSAPPRAATTRRAADPNAPGRAVHLLVGRAKPAPS